MSEQMSGQEETRQKLLVLNSVFMPAAPIEKRDFFAGRVAQIQQVLDAAVEPGRHAVIYGERGVGKTSLANILSELLPDQRVIKVGADTSDNYDSLWRKILKRVRLTYSQRTTGFVPAEELVYVPASTLFPADQELKPDDVASLFQDFAQPMILILDEFDRVTDESTGTLMADTVKAFSDSLSFVTLVVVGVAQTVTELIGEHPSVERNIRQIKLPRMSGAELEEIMNKGYAVLSMTIEHDLKIRITHLSRGFPHYTHLLAKYCAKQAMQYGRSAIIEPDLQIAIEQAVEDTHESIRAAYYTATIATRRETLFPKILLAAAMAAEDDYGTFRATDLLGPLCTITGQEYIVPRFAYHLGKLCSAERGQIFEKIGAKKRHRYRFTNPLMKPYVLMLGYSQGTIDVSSLNVH